MLPIDLPRADCPRIPSGWHLGPRAEVDRQAWSGGATPATVDGARRRAELLATVRPTTEPPGSSDDRACSPALIAAAQLGVVVTSGASSECRACRARRPLSACAARRRGRRGEVTAARRAPPRRARSSSWRAAPGWRRSRRRNDERSTDRGLDRPPSTRAEPGDVHRARRTGRHRCRHMAAPMRSTDDVESEEGGLRRGGRSAVMPGHGT